MELWDAYYRDGSSANRYLVRGEPIADGLYHLVSEILVQHIDGTFLLVQRDFNKPIHPGKYELSAGGSVLKGETALEGAKRELFEETGIKCEKLTVEFTDISDKNHSIFNMYYCVTDCDKDSVRLQEGETIAYEWISREELIKRIKKEPQKFCTIDEIRRCTAFKNSGI